jgi:riboflavin biosynthesis pyrimidine reductase
MANMVAGLDGTAAVAGRVGVLSVPADAELFRSLRALADVVLVGAQTVRAEGYGPVQLPHDALAERIAAGRPGTPRIAVVSRSLQLDWDSALFTAADQATIVITCGAADPGTLERARRAAHVIVAGDERVEIADALRQLRALGVDVVLCEGGPTLLGILASDGLLDELCLTLAPVMGGDPLPIAVTPAGGHLSGFVLRHVAKDEDTLFLRYERAS